VEYNAQLGSMGELVMISFKGVAVALAMAAIFLAVLMRRSSVDGPSAKAERIASPMSLVESPR
jgi:hypothetical protein